MLVTLAVAVFLYAANQGRLNWQLNWMPLAILGLVVLLAGWMAWILIVRRGILTWGRLARAPARALARGDRAEAERALSAALERARRFSPHDHRRGLMLLELAGYVKNQGRYADAKALFEECIDIMARRWQANPMDYFVALNNYAVYLIHVCDFMAAQNTMEKVLDLALFWKKGAGGKHAGVEGHVRVVESCLHLNLVFLFVRMDALEEAADHLEEADALVPKLAKRQRTVLGDHHCGMHALLLHAEGRYADAADALRALTKRDSSQYLHIRARLHLVAGEFSEAEQDLRKLLDQEGKQGSAHRPDLRDHVVELAESLFGQGKVDDAFRTLEEARSIVADFALPVDTSWRRALTRWRQRAEELGRTDALASLEADLQRIQTTPEQGITISTRLRVRAQ
ncbi:MAG TPA: hypothetical protein VKE98_19450 [Gemmataceae bacterium]|nr:hypothetical protein [Gemmataceae bacterium]